MKRLVALMLILSVVCFGSYRGRYTNDPASVRAAENSNSVSVADNENPETAYESLIARTDMGTLSATNRRTLILMPGTYTLTGTWELDTAYVDVVSVSGNYKDTRVTRATGGYTVQQTADNVSLKGFTVYNNGVAEVGDCAFVIAVTNTNSYYKDMFFDNGLPSFRSPTCVSIGCNFAGTWDNCGGSAHTFRVQGDPAHSTTYEMIPTMRNCWVTGGYSFGGDGDGPTRTTGAPDSFSIANMYAKIGATAVFVNCYAPSGATGIANFSGCTGFSVPIESGAKFINCHSGQNSFGVGTTVAGSFYNCTAGDDSFGGCPQTSVPSVFSGTAYNCTASDVSFGAGGDTLATAAGGAVAQYGIGYNSGTLINCRITSMSVHMLLSGASLRDCYIQESGTNKDCVVLKDSTSKLYNNVLIGTGSGFSIDARSKSVTAYATSDGGAKTQVSSAYHNLSNGESITIDGTTADQYEGTYTIEQVAAGTFVIPTAFGTNPATKGSWYANKNAVSAGNIMNLGLSTYVTNDVGTSYDVTDSDVQ